MIIQLIISLFPLFDSLLTEPLLSFMVRKMIVEQPIQRLFHPKLHLHSKEEFRMKCISKPRNQARQTKFAPLKLKRLHGRKTTEDGTEPKGKINKERLMNTKGLNKLVETNK